MTNASIIPLIQPERDVHSEARAAQARWALSPIRERLRIVRALRCLIAENADTLAAAAASASDRPVAEKLVSEVLPFADACRWLEKNARRVLAPRRCGSRGRPFWMRGVTFEVQRQPFGLVLVIGPGNYPLFLPAVHSLHALAAGNAVLLKPAPGTRHVALAFAQLARDAGLHPALLTVLPESVQAARRAIADGMDKVIFTGSSENGREVLATLAETNTPSVMELSGEDAVLVLADADLDLVVRALRFGTSLNGGETCIAPRRVIAVAAIADDLRARLAPEHRLPACASDGHLARQWEQAGSPLAAQAGSLCSVRDDAEAVARVNAADFALGASIFSRDVGKAHTLAARIKTGFVLINDLIVPTADPRMPFGGVKASGFGTTRGDEGLLEMTFPHVVAERHGRAHPHFDEPAPGDARLFAAYIRAAHGRRRFAAIRDLLGALIAKIKTRKTRL